MMDPLRVGIVGAGIAGLAASIRARVAGSEVEVFEQNSYTGGKMTAFHQEGYRFDAGPSLFTLPELVEELFTLAGKPMESYFSYHSHNEVCRYFWDDGTSMIMYPDFEKTQQELSRLFPEDAAHIATYFAQAAEKYELTAPYFLEQSLHRLKTFATPGVFKVIAAIPRLGLFNSLNEENEKHFKNPKLIQLFNRYATYNGSSPYLTPGIMQMITHLEHGMGTYLPKGGMHEISQSLTRLAKDLGVKFRLETPVKRLEFEGKKVKGIETMAGDRFEFDTVFVNSDVKHAYAHLLPSEIKRPKRTLAQEPSSSALIFYWGVQKEFPKLGLHNILFSENYVQEFERIGSNGPFWEDATVYVNITSKLEPSDAPEGCENWFVMINVPPNTGQDWQRIQEQSRAQIINRLNHVLGVDMEQLIVNESVLDPQGIEQKTSSVGGALYGTSSNERMAAFLRHPNKKFGTEGLYFCGGSAHPGGGVPLCLLSGKIATNWWKEDYGLE